MVETALSLYACYRGISFIAMGRLGSQKRCGPYYTGNSKTIDTGHVARPAPKALFGHDQLGGL